MFRNEFTMQIKIKEEDRWTEMLLHEGWPLSYLGGRTEGL